jgi:diguanylate cyclase (GGDEF)-like protein
VQAYKALLIPVGLLVTALATSVASYFESRVLESHFEQTAGRYSLAVEKELAVALESMHILKGLYDGSQFVDADEFAAATDDIYRRHNEVVAFAWLLPVAEASAASDANFANYKVTYLEQSATSAYSNAVAENLAAIEPAVFQKAVDTGVPTLLEYAVGLDEQISGVHILVPIYQPAVPNNLAARRQQLLGLVVGSYSFGHLLRQTVHMAIDPHVSYRVTSHGEINAVQASPSRALFAIDARDELAMTDLSVSQDIVAVDRRWSVQTTASEAYVRALRSYLPELVCVCLLALVAAFAWIMRQSERVTKDVAYQVIERTKALNSANRRLQLLAHTDYLTGLPNRRSFDEALEAAIESNKSIGLMLIDVDYFKNYNDHYGHQAGDECLQRVSQVLRRVTQSMPGVLVGRYGGEEFALLATEYYPLAELAETLREAVAKLAIKHRRSSVAKVITISLGVLEPTKVESDSDVKGAADALLMQADKALYLAKASGRNQVLVADVTEVVAANTTPVRANRLAG